MRLFLILTAICLLPVHTFAQEVMLETRCRTVGDDVENGAEYTPGVDVHGNQVASADLNQDLNKDLYPLEIPIEIDTIKMLDLPLDPKIEEALKGDANIAHVIVFEDGHVEYNGVDVSDHISHKCLDAEQQAEIEEIVSQVTKARRQQGFDNVVSPPDIEPAAGEEEIKQEGVENSAEPTSETDE